MWWFPNWLTKALGFSTFQVGDEDVVVFVVGPSGSGKSSFAREVARCDLVRIGRDLRPCTASVQAIRRKLMDEEKNVLGVTIRKNVVFVDTPSFHTGQDDYAAEREMRSWLNKSNLSRSRCFLAGIIYMHRIETDPNTVSVQQHLNTFSRAFPSDFVSFPNKVHGVLSYEGLISEDVIRLRGERLQRQLGSLRPSLRGRLRWSTSSHPELFKLGDAKTALQALVTLFSHSRPGGSNSIDDSGDSSWLLVCLDSEYEYHRLHHL